MTIKKFWSKNIAWQEQQDALTAPINAFLDNQLTKQWAKKSKKSPSSICITDAIARYTLNYFTSVQSTRVDGQLDISALKAVMNSYDIFAGWYDPKTKDGWFTTFFDIGKIRNNLLGHNSPQVVSVHDAKCAKNKIEALFLQIEEIVGDNVEMRTIQKYENEVRKILKQPFKEESAVYYMDPLEDKQCSGRKNR